MKQRIYEILATVAFVAGVVFGVFEVIYGYFFRVWYEAYDGLTRGYDAMRYPTKLGELMLFGFLAVFCMLMSLAASSLARRGTS